jgi:hypothetical protein
MSIEPEVKPIPVAIVSYNQPLGNRVFKVLFEDGGHYYIASHYAYDMAQELKIKITYVGE